MMRVPSAVLYEGKYTEWYFACQAETGRTFDRRRRTRSCALRCCLMLKCCDAADADLDIDAGAEAVDDGDQAVGGETAEVGVANARKVGSSDAGAGVGSADGQAVV